MKCAIVYRGFYMRNGNNKKKRIGNYFKCYDNHTKMLFDCFDEVDVYFHTYSYNEKYDKKLVQLLKPIKYIIDKEVGDKKVFYSIMKSNELVDINNNYDTIINTRFDLLFHFSMTQLNIDYTKFNFPFKDRVWDNKMKLVPDLLYIMPAKYINLFNKSLIKSQEICVGNGSGHYLYTYLCELIEKNNINFILDKRYPSNTDVGKNKLIHISRTF